ncbi:putative HTH transcriptional regulator [Solibacillus kalamii]|nr:putative HTH transcriptional regulator [Solibacillus kalamii]
MDFNEVIHTGESKYVKFKSWMEAKKKELMNTLTSGAVGFANTNGRNI